MIEESKTDETYDVVTVEKLHSFYEQEQLVRPYELFRLHTMKGGRIYFREMEDGTPRFYMGATSASKYLMTPQLLRWWADSDGYDMRMKEMNDKATYGSYFHSLIAKLAKGDVMSIKEIRQEFDTYMSLNSVSESERFGFGEMMVKDILSYLEWCDNYQVKPMAIEMPLCSDTVGVATLIDFVGTINDTKADDNGEQKKSRGRQPRMPKLGEHQCIIDFKSGKSGTHESHIMQLESNKELFQENFPDLPPIERYYNLSPKLWRKEPTYSFINQTEKMNQDRYDALITLAKTDMERVLNRQIMTIEGKVQFGTSGKALIRRFTIQEVVQSGEWKNFMPKELPV